MRINHRGTQREDKNDSIPTILCVLCVLCGEKYIAEIQA
jgi:hypothetical protein